MNRENCLLSMRPDQTDIYVLVSSKRLMLYESTVFQSTFRHLQRLMASLITLQRLVFKRILVTPIFSFGIFKMTTVLEVNPIP